MKYYYIVYAAEQDKNRVNAFTGEHGGSDYEPGYYADVLRVALKIISCMCSTCTQA